MAAVVLRAVCVRRLATCACRVTRALAVTRRGLVPSPHCVGLRLATRCYSSTRPAAFAMQADGDNQSAGIASLKETAALDQLIDLLLEASSEQQVCSPGMTR
jgi:hypothetical protein